MLQDSPEGSAAPRVFYQKKGEISKMSTYTLAQWFLFFYFYCFCGWVWESCYVSILKRHWVNRGFLHGPLLPIYGFGAITVLIATMPVRDNVVLVYVMGMIGATILEYFTGALMESLFHVRYWDYSNHRFNLNGHICLACSIGWGFFSIAMVYLVQEPVAGVLLQIPEQYVEDIVGIITVVAAGDTMLSVREALHLKELLKDMTQNSQELQRLQKRMDVILAVLGDDTEKIRDRVSAGIEKNRENLAQTKETLSQTRLLKELERMKGELEQAKNEMAQKMPGKAVLYRQASRILKRNPGSISAKYKKALEEMKENFEKEVNMKKGK